MWIYKKSKKKTDQLDAKDCEEKSTTKSDDTKYKDKNLTESAQQAKHYTKESAKTESTNSEEKRTEKSVDTQPKGNNITESAEQTGKFTKKSENTESDDTQSDDDNESLKELCKDLRYRRSKRVVKNKELKIILAAKRKSEMDSTNDDSEKKYEKLKKRYEKKYKMKHKSKPEEVVNPGGGGGIL